MAHQQLDFPPAAGTPADENRRGHVGIVSVEVLPQYRATHFSAPPEGRTVSSLGEDTGELA
jgi:hypothetical protein